MTDAHLSYSDADSTSTMHADARAARDNLHLERIAQAAVQQAPSIHFDDFPREVRKPVITVSDQAVLLANALHLHLD